jgi:hypothetical protein
LWRNTILCVIRIRETWWPTAIPSAIAREVDEEVFFHLLHVAILSNYVFLYSYCRKNISQRFLNSPCMEYVDTSWTRTASTEAIRETSKYYHKCW